MRKIENSMLIDEIQYAQDVAAAKDVRDKVVERITKLLQPNKK